MKSEFAPGGRRAFSCLILAFIVHAAPLAAQELIVNGGFELGRSGFASEYAYSPGDISSAGKYDILADPHTAYGNASSYGDHTSGHGLMMAANGALTQGATIWSQTAPLARNTLYTLRMWISSCTSTQPAVLNIYVNSALKGSVQAPGTPGVWQQFIINFNSGSADSAFIEILDSNTANNGNDFALDDISLKCCQNSTGQWVADGVAVCTAAGPQLSPDIAPDGTGGSIIAWYDDRGGAGYDIYAQRVNDSGVALWTANGVAVSAIPENQESPSMVTDGAGGAIVVWQDYRSGTNYDIYAQRMSGMGAVLWAADGVDICAAAGDQTALQVIPDGAGGAIVVWQDYRNGTHYDIFVQRVNGSGVVQWVSGGVPLCTATGNQSVPQLVSDGAGGAIVAWQDSRDGNDIYAQRVSAGGAVQWTMDGVAISVSTGNQYAPQLASDGSGGAIVAWQDSHAGNDICAQRVSASGAVQWTANGVAVSTASGNQYSPRLVSDGAGGAIVAWHDGRAGNTDIYAQRMSASGAAQWAVDGIPLCTEAGTQQTPLAVSDGGGGAVVLWYDSRAGNTDIYAQRVSASGAALWALDGVAVCAADETQYAPRLIADGAGGVTVAWDDSRGGPNSDIYAQRLDAAGHTVCATLLREYAAAFVGGGFVISWTLSEYDESAETSVMRAAGTSGPDGAGGDPDEPFGELPIFTLSRDGLSFSYVDRNWEAGASYWYRVEYAAGGGRTTLFEIGPITTPAMPLALYPSYPNPFNPSTTIEYYLPEDTHVRLLVFDAAGRRIASLVNEHQRKGAHASIWNGKGDDGRAAASGVYFGRLQAGKKTLSRKMILLR
jgi:hypothetical protein